MANEATPLPYTKEEIEEEGGFVTGWCINVHYGQGGNITEGCTTTHGHNTNGTDRTRSQRMGRVFKTKEDARTHAGDRVHFCIR